ncbi:MBL fold metallo-hydrolase [uncultured Mailhella sp.]|uniref:MBL fold metallo-hydrolase RNA specificity domain-containing protein n=1 Tax=uncultured Mailhella sp. TaxID=1981031 RepID=UPI0026369178|nr:MBL fold metallo-hydrolase [uncultured Mailhella sp.]
MNITFLGAAQTVTGSCYVIRTGDVRFAVDCGMVQGNSAIEVRNYDTETYDPEHLDFILLTHAHIDHSGLLPRMVKHGFAGNIYCTAPTADLAALMLEDSAHIQETEQEWKSSHNQRKGREADITDEALYLTEDALATAKQLRAVPFGEAFEPAPGVRVTFRFAGHILGAALLDITVTEDGKSTRLVFSGDLGRPGALLLPDAETPETPDWLFVESTYGDRNHKGENDTLEELSEAIAYSYQHKEKVLIPAFAVERTQEILYSLILLRKQGRIPADMPVYVDSPMAAKATKIFVKYASHLRAPDLTLEDINKPEYAVTYTQTVKDSQELNLRKGPAIILSASGMCNAGRIRHHLKHNIWKPGVSIVFVGYQAMGTPGRKLVDGAKTLRLFGDELNVEARIFTINGFSAHAGQSQLLDWIGSMARPGMNVALIHGEPKAQTILAGLIKERFGITPVIPEYLEELSIQPGTLPAVHQPRPEASRPRVDWNFLMQEMDQRMAQLRDRMAHASDLPWEEQLELRDRLAEIEHDLFVFLSHM